MGFPSQAGQLLLGSQATPDTFSSTFATSHIAIRTRSGGLAANRDLLVPDPEIGGNRDVSDAYMGAVQWSGDFDFYARMKEMALILKGVLGTSAVVTTTGVSVHTATPVDATALPWLSAEHAISTSFECFRYTDVKINTLHLEADANGYLMGTMGLIARKETSGNTRTASPVFDTSPMVVGTNITVTYNSVQLPAKSFSFDVNNNLEDDDFRLGSLYLGDVTEKRREVTAGINIRPADSALWKAATYGAGATTAPTGLTSKNPLVITMTTYEDIPGGTPLTKYSLSMTFPSAILAPLGITPSGDDVIEHDFEVRIVRPNPGTPIVTAVTKNDLAVLP